MLNRAAAAQMIPAQRDALAWGSTLDWAMALTVGLMLLIVACIVAARIVYRGRQAEGSALWLHLLCLGVFPLFLLVLGNFAVLESAKEEQFCGTCHLTMKPYVDDLHDPKGKSLAAKHFQDRFAPGTECYACHADYGLHGTFEAKLQGLHDSYRYVTRTYRLPLKMPTPFANTLCLKCHDGARSFMAEELHVDGDKVSDDLRTGKTRCVRCHKPAHHIPGAGRVAAGGRTG